MKTKQFPLRVLLTVTTGRLLTEGKGDRDNGIDDLYELLGWMTNDQPFTHQLGRFGDECRPWLFKWWPNLEKAESPQNLARLDTLLSDARARGEHPEQSMRLWLSWIMERGNCDLPELFDVPQIHVGDHERKDPVRELIELRESKEGIVVVKLPDAKGEA